MKLDSDDIPCPSRPHRGGEPILLVLAPCDHRSVVVGTTGKAVGVIRDAHRSDVEDRVTRILERVPADLRHPACGEPCNATGNNPQSTPRTLVTLVEEELHAEANAERRQLTVDDCVSHHLAP